MTPPRTATPSRRTPASLPARETIPASHAAHAHATSSLRRDRLPNEASAMTGKSAAVAGVEEPEQRLPLDAVKHVEGPKPLELGRFLGFGMAST